MTNIKLDSDSINAAYQYVLGVKKPKQTAPKSVRDLDSKEGRKPSAFWKKFSHRGKTVSVCRRIMGLKKSDWETGK